jgi:DNA-binding CsgD family transcriptional regulator
VQSSSRSRHLARFSPNFESFSLARKIEPRATADATRRPGPLSEETSMSPDIPPAGPASITPRQAIVIDLLATGLTITKAAEQGGIARKTAYNWLESATFRAALDHRRREFAAHVADRVAELGQTCLTTLMDYLTSEDKDGYGSQSRVKLAAELIEKMGLLAAPSPARRRSDPA